MKLSASLLFLLGLVSLSSGLKCQVCSFVADGDGTCSNDEDNGESMECDEDQDVCVYFKGTLNATEGEQELVTRSCGFGGVLGDSCVNIDQNGIVGKVCQCTMDNCNKDHQCKCPSGPKLNCQVCEDGGICNSTTDNGVSMECPISSNFESACWYIHEVIDGEMGTFRNCGEKLPETCNILDAAGTKVTVCNCQTDNCNKDNQCDCSSNPTTQGPQTTTSSSTTTIGISALALLVSAFVLFEMK